MLVFTLVRLYSLCVTTHRVQIVTGIEKAIELAKGQVNLATKLGVRQQSVSQWLARGWVPKERAKEIEATFGIPRIELVSPKLRDLLEPTTFEQVAS